MRTALVAVTLATFAGVWSFGFVNFDDPQYIINNPHVSTGLTWANVVWAFTSGYAANWHPVTWLSHMIDVTVFGLAPGPAHAVNLALHVANVLLLFAFFVRTTGAAGRSAVVAALFAVHPLHVESVAWISERKDVLSTFFGLCALLAYAGYVRQPKPFAHARRLRGVRAWPDGEADARDAAVRAAARGPVAARPAVYARAGSRKDPALRAGGGVDRSSPSSCNSGRAPSPPSIRTR